MYQFGRFGAGNIRAWRGVVEASRGFAARWNPRVKIDFDVASGDRNRSSANLGTFNSFFQSGEYSGRAGLLGASNSIRLEPTLTLAPRRNVSVSTGWGFYWRETRQDGLYGIPGNLIVPSTEYQGAMKESPDCGSCMDAESAPLGASRLHLRVQRTVRKSSQSTQRNRELHLSPDHVSLLARTAIS